MKRESESVRVALRVHRIPQGRDGPFAHAACGCLAGRIRLVRVVKKTHEVVLVHGGALGVHAGAHLARLPLLPVARELAPPNK